MLHRYRFLTYGHLITTAVTALKRPDVFRAVHDPIRHLFVDEYQDINPAQEELIRLLARTPVCLYVVGDDDQAIYQWRGSDVGNIQKFVKRYPFAKTLPLSTNRRSRPRIIEAANKFAKSIVPRLDKKMEKKREAGGPELFSWSAETALVVPAVAAAEMRVSVRVPETIQ
jgi:DNA helicase II / ATP-dependent DNA helicase PcrA